MTLVSVVMPVRNGADHVLLACRTALGQTEQDLELIVVDDGSTDGTSDIVASVQDPRVRFFETEPSGVSAARNLAIEAAVGEWVAFLDADDLWEPSKLERQLAVSADADLVFTDAWIQQVGESRPLGRFHAVSPAVFDETDPLPSMLRRDNFVPTSSVLVRRSALRDVGGFDESLAVAEDLDLWLRLAAAGARFRAVRDPLVTYVVSPTSASASTARTLAGEAVVMDRLVTSLPASDRRAAQRRARRARALASAAAATPDAPVGERLRILLAALAGRVGWRFSALQALRLVAPATLHRLRPEQDGRTRKRSEDR